ncbi:unnamed protein product, partial [Ectocarpus fasciculatus]
LPLGDAAWPKRVEVLPVDWPSVVAVDTPVRLTAEVQRGATENLRVWLSYRFEYEGGEAPAWGSAARRVLMNPQSVSIANASSADTAAPRFSVQIDPPVELARMLIGRSEPAQLVATLEAGHDVTDAFTIPVVLRPGLATATATLVPPTYARPYVPTQEVDLAITAERLGTLNALQGAQLT